MSQLDFLPNKYHIVWLDAHIGEPNFCHQLKRAFFTHLDPESGQEIQLSDKDIDLAIQSQSEIPVVFDTFHFTLKAFVEEATCLNYIDEIQNHRILFIASSRLGESAVKQLLERYPHSFTNIKTNEPYDSIYIFCTDVLKASQWAASYVDYVKIFEFETDLLSRITKDLGEEFLKHGQDLLEAHENEAAIERLSWAKSLFIRHDKLKFPSVPQNKQQRLDANMSAEHAKQNYTQSPSNKQSKPSPRLQEIDRLLEEAEQRTRQQQENDSDDDETVDDINVALKRVEILQSEAKKSITEVDPNDDNVEQRLQRYILEKDGDSVAVIFIVGLKTKLPTLTAELGQLITCTTNEQIISAIRNVQVSTRIIIVSSILPSNDVLSLTQLLNYYCVLKSDEAVKTLATNHPNVTYINSIDHLMSPLYHKLGQYYRDSALQTSIKSKDRHKAIRLLDRSTKCYKLLEDDTKKILEHYAEILKTTDPQTEQ